MKFRESQASTLQCRHDQPEENTQIAATLKKGSLRLSHAMIEHASHCFLTAFALSSRVATQPEKFAAGGLDSHMRIRRHARNK